MTRQLTTLFSMLLIWHSVFASTDSSFQDFLNQWRTQNHITSVVVSVEETNTHHIP